jgi:uncharacterized membrane protein YraQ (UPF0718 family)
MVTKKEIKLLALFIAVFCAIFYLPLGNPRFNNSVFESLYLLKWYAREHVISCLIPAFFIAGAISVFINRASVMKYLGPSANKFLAYGVASISGTILAVCSCTVLPLFAGIYRMGAGIGPATAFLYSGPAINVLAIILTARILGIELGVARAVGAIFFSIIIGLIMHLIYRRGEMEKAKNFTYSSSDEIVMPLWKNVVYFFIMIGILVFANWGKTSQDSRFWVAVYSSKWLITGIFSIFLGIVLILWFRISSLKVILAAVPPLALSFIFPDAPVISFTAGIIGLSVITSLDQGESGKWFDATWDYAKQITPLLLAGVFIAGFLLGRPGNEGIIPSVWISNSVGGNSFMSNFVASFAGAFMYFATLTEVPILQGLIGQGMGKGPALALLLAGPALSLPSMLVLKSIIGLQKTIVYVSLVIIMATISGMIYGYLF